ncbi:MAG: permease-like cell division protein FtsX [bacterium]|nr:permease-like cell division protein FtsX [bacterium]
MIWTSIKRITRSGFINFWRNGFVSFSSVSTMTITLSVIGLLIFSSALFKSSLEQLKNKVDINVYFVTSAPESDILALKNDIKTMPEVKSADYVSREEVLSEFKIRHENDQLTLQALEELGENPFGATLNIRAKETSQYESITKFLESKSGTAVGATSIISKINYYDNKKAIDSLTGIIEAGKLIGTVIVSIFITISIIVTFVMIQLVIYISREEVSVMRLVGASTTYIRGPLVVTGIMYGVIAGFVTLIILYIIAYYLASGTAAFFGGINILSYYVKNFPQILLIILGSGVFLGAISSYLAVRRHLTL